MKSDNINKVKACNVNGISADLISSQFDFLHYSKDNEKGTWRKVNFVKRLIATASDDRKRGSRIAVRH